MIAQLVRTRNNQILHGTDLPYPQFVLLLHFCHDPEREWTVSSLARAFQRKQPGITKTVRQLLDRGFLRSRPDRTDARVKNLRVTARGIRARDAAMVALAPALADDFGNWKRSEISELHRLVERLKEHLDEQRAGSTGP
ncbi:MAG: winged helix-turn-helix transcriptional regulator [bacterium]|nr:winged helix-turn-helix transcriptional regulator [bacterium]